MTRKNNSLNTAVTLILSFNDTQLVEAVKALQAIQSASVVVNDAPKKAEPAPKKAESAPAPKTAEYLHGQIKATASGKSVTFVYGDTGKTVNDGRIYAEFKKLGGTWDKSAKAYVFKSATAASKAAKAMDHYSAI